MRVRRLYRIAIAGLLLGLLAACTFQDDPVDEPVAEADGDADAADDAEVDGETSDEDGDDPGDADGAGEGFTIAVGIDIDTLDPIGQTTTTVQNIVDYSVETLLSIDENGDLQPGLAEEWDFAEDGLSMTFQLREGVEFHDGTPLDAEAVVWNLERVIDEELTVPIRGSFTRIESVEAVDELTVEVTQSEPYVPIQTAIAGTTAGILSPAGAEEHGNSRETYQHPVGTGPYEFVEYATGEHVRYERFDGYWGEAPYYETVEFQIVPEAATRVSQVLSGQADMIILPPVSDLPSLEDDPAVEVLLAPSNRSIFMAFNTQDEVLGDPRVRQALNYAVNTQELIDSVLPGAAEIMDGPMESTTTGYCAVGEYPYDPERATELLEEAGATDLSLTMITPSGRYVQDQPAVQAIAGYFSEIGVDTSVDTMDWSTYVGTIQEEPTEDRVDAHLLGWAPSNLDADGQLVMFREADHPPVGLATSLYTDERVEELLLEAAGETDEALRDELYCEASEIIWEDAPWLWMWTQRFPIVYSSDVTGIGSFPDEKFDAIYARPAD